MSSAGTSLLFPSSLAHMITFRLNLRINTIESHEVSGCRVYFYRQVSVIAIVLLLVVVTGAKRETCAQKFSQQI
jgi:hypothetical protein